MISVIIPTFRDDERLNKCLQSLYSQSLEKSKFEVIVVNNYPSDEVKVQVEGLNLIVTSEEKQGSYAARNKGIEEANGEILAFTDSDCLPDRNWLFLAKEFFDRDTKKEIGVLTGPVPLFFKDTNRLSPSEIYEKYTAFKTEQYAQEGFAVTANWFSYASVIQDFGGFNSELMSNGDTDLSGKISKKYNVVFSPEVKVFHPARYQTKELVDKYRRVIGGNFHRRFKEKPAGFRIYIYDFLIRRYRFALKKILTVPPRESLPILKVCHKINKGVLQEFFHLIDGGEPKR
ncbi:glycosyltransferase family 2 protein [Litoribacter alkaliphilus]|uniref:Glycosyltransferase family 2 protein n=1 Tax=Litoribacter ruber TaxID=702568 RepID=A0AAP2CIZ0_9BACT|nr:glycosyltransferase family 2 protein [Litoribacter alkaliphilus]MBS9525598.1 glycosyltransferase family 2 protein [Litoribacter alkaliphilus]